MRKKLNIYLIRHGEKEINEDPYLTKRGRKQIKLLAKRLQKEKITEIYSSDLNRCKETAEIISKRLKLQIKYTKVLRELPSIVKENPLKYKKEINKVKKFWDKITNEKGNILLSSSGIVNRILISFALDIKTNKANFMQYPSGLTRIEKMEKEKKI